MLSSASTLAAFSDYFYWWQIPLVLGVVVLLVFWKIYRSKQM